jgi:purine-nucleoside phosphorylase
MTLGQAELEGAQASLKARLRGRPRVGLVLGTGLGGLARQIEPAAVIPHAEIPHFPRSTAPDHRGQVVCGHWSGVPVIALDGRCHLYEGYSALQVAFPVRVLASLGIELLVLSNACGGLNPNYRSGDLMVIEDHINLTWDNPLKVTHDVHTAAIPDMSCPYDPHWIEVALETARRHDIVAHRGTYVGVCGPSYETRAEYRMLRRSGADAVGMSTVCETIVAAQCQLPVLGLSVVTNVCRTERPRVTSCEQVVAVALTAEHKVQIVIDGVIQHLAREPRARVGRSDQHAHDGGGHEAGQGAAQHRA